jgi:hypothetical protein
MDKELLNKLFEYKDGTLLWRNPRKGTRLSKVAGTLKDGYLRVSINKKLHYAHRLIFMYHNGYFPEYIDHINRDRSDNRIENLRECDASQNLQNSSVRSDSTTKVRGVSKTKYGKYRAYITINRKQKFLGSFETLELAINARISASVTHFGGFSNERI